MVLDERVTEILGRLQAITKDCRPDMHEPDEQGLRARVIGNYLDNACGDSISSHAIEGGFQEFVVVLERYANSGHVIEKFNLADLIALARRAG